MFVNKVLSSIILCLIAVSQSYGQSQSTAYLRDLEDRMAYSEEQNRHLINKIEELSHKLKQTQQQLDVINQTLQQSQEASHQKTSSAVEIKGKKAPAEKKVLTTQTTTTMTVEQKTFPEGDAQFDYDQAISLLNRGDHDDAEAAFKNFIKRYPKSPLIVNAQYWLGETYLAQKLYAEAAVSFAEAYQTYKNQTAEGASQEQKKQSKAKAPEALIKLAFALKGLKKSDEACATLDQVKTEFPQLSYNLIKLAERARHGLRCRKEIE